jgi:hypothetical protein
MKNSMLHSIPRMYYFVTPAFILMDYVWGINASSNAIARACGFAARRAGRLPERNDISPR